MKEIKPGPKENILIGSAAAFAKDPIKFLTHLGEDYDGIAYFKFGLTNKSVFIGKPDWVQQVLQKNNKNYQKGIEYKRLALLLGNGLLNSEGDFWLKQRRLSSPAFHRKKIADFGDTMVKWTNEMLEEKWNQHAESGKKFDLTQDMNALTLGIIGDTMMSWTIKDEAGSVYESLSWLIEDVNQRVVDVINLPLWVPTSRNIKFKKESKVLGEIMDKIIDDHMKNPEKHSDLLGMLIEAVDEETGDKMNHQQLKEEALTIFAAGHETTALGLTWAFYLLDNNPHELDRLLKEIDEVLEGKSPSMEDLPNLPFLSRVVDEVLRYYPPAWIMGRNALDDDQFGEHKLEKGMDVFLSPYVMHHHPKYWKDPEKFDPDRFLPEREKEREKYAYYPFGGGPRLCIGNNFALMEMKLILIRILQKYKVKIHDSADPAMKPLITLRPKGKMYVTLEKR